MYQEVAFLGGTSEHQLTTLHPCIPIENPIEISSNKGSFYKRAHQLLGHSRKEDFTKRSFSTDGSAIINVGGIRYCFPWSALEEFPLTRLGKLCVCRNTKEVLDLCDDYDAHCNEFFFDRSPHVFRYIVTFLAAGKLRIQQEICSLSLQEELLYWGLEETSIEWCCLRKLWLRQQEQCKHSQQEKDTDKMSPQTCKKVIGDEDQEGGHLMGYRHSMKNMVENVYSGMPRKIFPCLSVVFVVITAVTLCVSTMPDLTEEKERGECSHRCYNIFVLETVCLGWFSLEFLLRFIKTKRKCLFLRTPLNIIDIVAILPYYITLIVDSLSSSDQPNTSANYLEKAGLTLQVVRALRIFYVMRLARHSVGLQTLGLTICRCTHEFSLLLLFLCVAMALFSPLVFLAESEMGAKQEFTSIPSSYWWAVISMTTVGYGDMVPHSIPGQVVALSSILSGILLMAFPVTSIFHTFSRSYLELKEEQSRPKHHKHDLQNTIKSLNSEDSQDTDSSLHIVTEPSAVAMACQKGPKLEH